MTYLEAKSKPGGTDTGVDRALVQLCLSREDHRGVFLQCNLLSVHFIFQDAWNHWCIYCFYLNPSFKIIHVLVLNGMKCLSSNNFLTVNESGKQNIISHQYLPNSLGEGSRLDQSGQATSSDPRFLERKGAEDLKVYFFFFFNISNLKPLFSFYSFFNKGYI